MTEEQEKAKLIKDALKIVDQLGKLHPFIFADEEDVEILVEEANKLTKNKHWRLT